jgi:hypothetical protein
MQAHVRVASEQRRPFGERLLNPVLTEVALSGLYQLVDFLGVATLADGDQPHVGRVALRELGCPGNGVEDLVASVGGAGHRLAL